MVGLFDVQSGQVFLRLLNRLIFNIPSLIARRIIVPMKMSIHPPRRWKMSRASCSPML